MLSINIPVYNIEVYDLVEKLQWQAQKLQLHYEIRVYDDLSEAALREKNRKITNLENVVYLENEKNLGRAAIRNRMGLDSKYELLLFIDADSQIVNDNYLKKYLDNVSSSCVLCGGTVYSQKKPDDPQKILRWVYGTEREATSAKYRNNSKGFIITSNNFLIEKKLFQKIHFREHIRNYGHEDTVLGFDLFKDGIEIEHIENPVEHIGLEQTDVFLEKTKLALKNLNYISENVVNNDEAFTSQVYFLRRYNSIKKWMPLFVLRTFYFLLKNLIEKNLKGTNPSMLCFDVFKLGFYSTIKNRKQK